MLQICCVEATCELTEVKNLISQVLIMNKQGNWKLNMQSVSLHRRSVGQMLSVLFPGELNVILYTCKNFIKGNVKPKKIFLFSNLYTKEDI